MSCPDSGCSGELNTLGYWSQGLGAAIGKDQAVGQPSPIGVGSNLKLENISQTIQQTDLTQLGCVGDHLWSSLKKGPWRSLNPALLFLVHWGHTASTPLLVYHFYYNSVRVVVVILHVYVTHPHNALSLLQAYTHTRCTQIPFIYVHTLHCSVICLSFTVMFHNLCCFILCINVGAVSLFEQTLLCIISGASLHSYLQ